MQKIALIGFLALVSTNISALEPEDVSFRNAAGGSTTLRIERFTTIDSTQLEAKRRLQELTADRWHVLLAEKQTQGRGNDKRSWNSLPGNIYATYMVPLPDEQEMLARFIPQVVAMALSMTVEAFGLETQIRWPNDVMIEEAKVSGILCECEPLKALPLCGVLIGIGLNVNREPDVSDQLATSLAMKLGMVSLDKEKVFQCLNQNLVLNLTRLMQLNSFESFIPYIAGHLAYQGETVLVVDREGAFQADDATHPTTKKGKILGITEDGFLRLQTETGEEELMVGRVKKLTS